jgi:transglutaminase-like putative cysteine protease
VVGISLFGGCSGASTETKRETARLIGTHDVALERDEQFTVERAEKGYRLTRTVEVSTTYLSQRATDDVTHYLGEQYFAPVTNLKAYLDGDRLPGDQIVKTIPERSDVFLDDFHTYRINYKSLRIGQTASYRYEQRYEDIGFLPVITIPNIDFVKRYSIVFRHPPGVHVDFKLFCPRQRIQPLIQRLPHQTTISFSDLGRQDALPDFTWNDLQVVVWPQLVEAGRPLHPVDAETYTRWYFGLGGHLDNALSSDQERWLQTLTRAAVSPRQKVKAIYDFVRRNVRYLADERSLGGIVPRPPRVVLERRYGDCKDKAHLVARLAERLGIKVDTVLLGTETPFVFEGIHNAMFNHLIASFDDGGGRVFFDPTCQECEFGNLPETDVGSVALLLDAQRPRKLILAAPQQSPSLELEIDASTADLAHATARLTVRNRLFYRTMWLRRTAATAKLQTELSELLGGHLYNILLHDFRFQTAAEDHAVLVAVVDLSRFVTRSAAQIYVPQIPFAVVHSNILERGSDTFPIHLTYREHLQLRLRLSAPGLRHLTQERVEWGSPSVAQFSSHLTQQDGTFTLSYFYREWLRRLSGAARQEYLAFCKRYLDTRRALYVLKRGEP